MPELDVVDVGTASSPGFPSPPRRRADSEAPPSSQSSSSSDPLEIGAILPVLDDGEGALDPLEVSPELAQILDTAEQRATVLGRQQHPSIPVPGEEIDPILPLEMLA